MFASSRSYYVFTAYGVIVFTRHHVVPPHGRNLPALTSAAVPPAAGAAPRMPRGVVAGRRAVQVVLLVGGLFVLGVLFGERASAADVPSLDAVVPVQRMAAPVRERVAEPVKKPVARVTEPAAGVTKPVTQLAEPVAQVSQPVARAVRPVGRPVTDHVVRPVAEDVVAPVVDRAVRPVERDLVDPVAEDLVQPVTDDLVRPVTEGVVKPIAEQVVEPVGEVVESVTEGLGDATAEIPPVTSLPSWPVVPGLPELPELPGLPGLPVWPVVPGDTLPAEATPSAPGGAGVERSAAVEVVRGERGAGGSGAVAYGRQGRGGAVVGVAVVHRDAGGGDARSGRVPGPQSPDELPSGGFGGHAGTDNGGPRHAEPHAVTSLHRAPLSLVRGAITTDVVDGTRDRHRDIPEFPG
ncbi:hypothetical protein ACWD4G_25640 [Streptomyces sp. NPDC002643]